MPPLSYKHTILPFGRVANLAILNTGETPHKIRHIHEKAAEFLHVIGITVNDLLDGVHSGSESTAGYHQATGVGGYDVRDI